MDLKDILGLAKATKYGLNTITKLVTGLAKPYQIRRVAEAESYAANIKSESDGYRIIQIAKAQAYAKEQVCEIEHRALMRQLETAVAEQTNIEEIAKTAIRVLETKESKPSEDSVDDDWITEFREQCKGISDEDMQVLWGKILAEEIYAPGSFSPRTLAFLRTLRKREADIFTRFCSAILTIPETNHLLVIRDTDWDNVKTIGPNIKITYDELLELDAIGLVQNVGSPMGSVIYNIEDEPDGVVFTQGPNALLVKPINPEDDLKFNVLALTNVARELFKIAGASFHKEYLEELAKGFPAGEMKAMVGTWDGDKQCFAFKQQ